jgi:hypothetical protein
VTPLRRKFRGAITPEIRWRHYGENPVAPLRRKRNGAIAAKIHRRYASPVGDGWRRPVAIDAAAALAVLAALRDSGDRELAVAVVERLLATCALDAVLVEVARNVAADSGLMRFPPADRVRAAVLERIEERMAQDLSPPPDLRRASQLSCACRYCVELARFLDDPGRASWTLKAAETHRRHVQATIQSNHCDVDCATIRQGSPHGLVCTKNQASYEARCRQRRADLALAVQLRVKQG